MSLRHALLGLLVDRPASGYDLLKLFDTSLAFVWPATQSQVYGELNRLAEAGLVDVSAEGPRRRKEYRVTDEGLRELRGWLVAPTQQQSRRSELLLKVFFFDLASDDQARAVLAERAELAGAHHQRLAELSTELEQDEGPLTAHGRIALEYGLRWAEMERDWARWAAEQLG
ncbi:PadR family transcriptional regulator [Streptomyces fuscichromogenes]|uniref:PadR family transcriptional regulator n=1 Tax=Streptomyces fuscichromogenes TaxID=1324013 RepID=A0A917XQ32_9ACTN|nr:PadR family transcriptional regulator [Streptomyces fuscichromogenes]GGN44457.1 PadR family transcriptional regulator [Streptomyces fuscichromogenes]